MRRHALIFGLLLSFALIFGACSSGKKEHDAVATVNDAPIMAEDILAEVARYARQNPSQAITQNTIDDQLKVMIEQKLLIQEAVKKRLHEDRKFTEAIKNYWEQTLIKDLIDAKTGEWSEKIFVTDDEVGKEYERMSYRPVMVALRARTKGAADEAAEAMRRGKTPAGAEAIGPVYHGDMKGSPLANAFDMEAGEVKVFATEDEFIVIHLLKKDKVPIPPLNSIQKMIKESLLEQKKQQAVKTWMANVKQSARITINDKLLKRIAHE
ncbi:MAG: SurA N-terminal domain-containing protein [Smithellaceae bacterium]|nr:SurA N-terminal domain-containing protein [Smithellaceae bacterium]